MSSRIKMIEGSSIALEVVDQARQVATDHERIMVCLDSMHTHEHVLAELEAYASLVTPGSYCVVFDTIIEDMPENTFPDRPWGVGNNPKNTSEAGKNAGFYKNNPAEYQKRIKLAIDQLVKAGADKNEIAVIGYCFGGTGAIEAARGNLNVKAVVSFHGGLAKAENSPTESIKAKVLVLHGADDPYVSVKEIEAFQNEMRATKADWQMVYYANAVHSFTHKDAGNDNSKGAAYNELADKRSWEAMKAFFKEVL